MPTTEDPNDKVREQIEEILEKEERRKPEPIRIARPVAPRKVRKVRSGTPIWYPTPEKLIVAGIILMVIAAITRSSVLPLVLVGFAMAGLGYYMIIMRKRRARYGISSGRSGDTSPKYWRGKPVRPSGQARQSGKVKKRDGNILEFPGSDTEKSKRRFGRKR